MKNKNPLIILIGSLLALGGAGIVIDNYTEDLVMLVQPCITEDGRLSQDTIWVAENRPILRHTKKKYGKRSTKDSLIIVVHHPVMDKESTANDVAKIHVKGNNWAGIGYHWGIDYKGGYEIYNTIETLSYHVRGSNTVSLAILCKGNFEKERPTEEMLVALDNLIESLKKSYLIKEVTIHKRMPKAATKCPGKYLEEALIKRNTISKDSHTLSL